MGRPDTLLDRRLISRPTEVPEVFGRFDNPEENVVGSAILALPYVSYRHVKMSNDRARQVEDLLIADASDPNEAVEADLGSDQARACVGSHHSTNSRTSSKECYRPRRCLERA